MDAENISSILFMLKKEKGKRTKGEGRGVTPDDRNQLFKVQKKELGSTYFHASVTIQAQNYAQDET